MSVMAGKSVTPTLQLQLLFYDDIVHEFSEVAQNKGHYAVQGHSRSPILVPIESSYTTSY